MIYHIGKYHGRWAVFDSVAGVWYFTKGGRHGAQKLADELNAREEK